MIVELFLGIAFLFLLWKWLKKPDNYPPGHWGFPGIGYIPIGGKRFSEQLKDLNKEHGNVFIWRMGTELMVFLFDYKLIKEALMARDFIHRPQNGTLSFLPERGENVGLLISNGLHWQNLRRFSLRQMKDLGMGKSRMVEAIHSEARGLIENFESRSGKAMPLPHSYHVAVVNVIWQMIADKRYSLDDPSMVRLEELMKEIQENAIQYAIPIFMPWIKSVLPNFLYQKLTKDEKFAASRKVLHDFMLTYVKEHQEKIDYDDPKDFIDAYLVEMKNQKDDPESTLSERDLVICCSDLFFAGSETTATTLQWASLYLANYQDVQAKLHKCVDDVMPKGTLPTLEDKPKLVYVEAFINEIHRHASFLSMGVMHSAAQDTTLGGYFIPKGATLNPIFLSAHFDPTYWNDPDTFDPERWIDENGKFKNIVEGFLPFGIGKRQCLGEALARMELFVFITAFAQHLHFTPPPGVDKMDLSEHPKNPFFRLPKLHQDIVITLR